MKITIIYDNNSLREDLKADWGFSCLIEHAGINIIFDTGANEEIFRNNLSALSITRSTIDMVFISHNHIDHTGGLKALLDGSPLPCILPASTQDTLGPKITSQGGIAIYVKEKMKIAPSVWSTGELQNTIQEQSLVIEEKKELILITGCSHPGIVNITKKVCLDFGKPPSLILGGFHFYNMSNIAVQEQTEQLKQLRIQRIAPCHCTGEKQKNLMKKFWGKNFLEPSAGWCLDWHTL